MNQALLGQFLQLISTHTGLSIRDSDRNSLARKILARTKVLKLAGPEAYFRMISRAVSTTNPTGLGTSQQEWKTLIGLITTGETYFFRDRGQLRVLTDHLLPELIAAKRAEYQSGSATQPCLRIWSAGCSTGEEPYSLAILVKELVPDLAQWNILILGTDLNPAAIDKAKRGIYTKWSFRRTTPELQRRYFHQVANGWQVNDSIRQMVSFRCGNLLHDPFPSNVSGINKMDLILCRNVFIYFDATSIGKVVTKFSATLNPNGYFLSGHTELHAQDLRQLQLLNFPESLVYQRSADKGQTGYALAAQTEFQQHLELDRGDLGCIHRETDEATAPIPPLVARIAVMRQPSAVTRWSKSGQRASPQSRPAEVVQPPITRPPPPSCPESGWAVGLKTAETLLRQGNDTGALKTAQQLIVAHPNCCQVLQLMAQAYFNLGEWDQATECCQAALKIDLIAIPPLYLLAQIAEQQGDCKQAKAILKKVIYISPTSIPAYLFLGALYVQAGQITQAQKMHHIAWELLKQLPHDALVDYRGKVTANELLVQVESQLKSVA